MHIGSLPWYIRGFLHRIDKSELKEGDVIIHNHPYLGASHSLDIAIIARVPFDEGSLTGTLTTNSTWPDGDWRNTYFTRERLAEVVERVERLDMLIPEGEITRLSDPDRHRIAICQDWFSDPEFMSGKDAVVLIAESRKADAIATAVAQRNGHVLAA